MDCASDFWTCEGHVVKGLCADAIANYSHATGQACGPALPQQIVAYNNQIAMQGYYDVMGVVGMGLVCVVALIAIYKLLAVVSKPMHSFLKTVSTEGVIFCFIAYCGFTGNAYGVSVGVICLVLCKVWDKLDHMETTVVELKSQSRQGPPPLPTRK